MKTIVVPTDFSDHALFALKVAASIAKNIIAGITLVHVYNLPSSGFEQYHYYDKFYNEIKTLAENQIAELTRLDFLKGIEVEKHVVTDMLMGKL
jgi:nucleotide-binding universal stress UspA family protein